MEQLAAEEANARDAEAWAAERRADADASPSATLSSSLDASPSPPPPPPPQGATLRRTPSTARRESLREQRHARRVEISGETLFSDRTALHVHSYGPDPHSC